MWELKIIIKPYIYYFKRNLSIILQMKAICDEH